VQEIQVESIRCEAAETALASGDGPGAGCVARQYFADQENFASAAGDCFADQFLGAAVRVHFCRIDQRQTEVKTEA
jgi:hypothetical protein